MREIKFRAWDKVLKKYVTTGFHVLGEVTAFGLIDGYLHETRDQRPDFDSILSLNDIEIEEWTGVTDKSKKDIYEGDILEFEDMGEEGYETKEGYDFTNHAVVVFHEGRFCLDKFRAEGAVEEEINEHDEMVEIFKSSAVVGNIHENAELLKSS